MMVNSVSSIKSVKNKNNSNENHTYSSEVVNIEQKVDKSNVPKLLKDKIQALLTRLKKMTTSGVYSKEYDIISEYVDWVTKIPWNKKSEEVLDLSLVESALNKEHYGLEIVKERIYQYVAVKKLLNDNHDTESARRSPILCMVGLQGIGKTTMAKSLAKALNRPFYRISMGAIGSVLEIRGRHKSIEGAEPGQIIKAIVHTKVMNPVILLDELDKASGQSGLLADIMATMLEILDPEQNNTFRDHYLDFPIDLSSIMFIVSANKIGTFSAALMDRLEVIRMPSYTDDEKRVIAKEYLLPRVRKMTGLGEDQLEITDDVWENIIRPLGFDSGIRSLQRMLAHIARQSALEIVRDKKFKVVITNENLRSYLQKY